MIADCVMDGFSIVLETHLFQHAGAIYAYSLGAERHALCNLGKCLARGDQAQSLLLAVGQCLVHQLFGIPYHAVEQLLGHDFAYVFLAADHLLYRTYELVWRTLFIEIARRTSF